MTIGEIVRRTGHILRDNSPAILTALGVSGTITTSYLAARASFQAEKVIEREERRRDRLNPSPPTMELKEKAQMVWKLYVPTVISGTLTIGCIIAGTRASTKKTAAAYSLLTVTEQAFTEYKGKVVEQLGEKKEKAIRDQIAQDRVTRNPPTIIVGSGTVLCMEMHTGRYFNCDMETIRKAENRVNAKVIRENEASLSDFYYLVGLEPTSYSSSSGWTSDRLLELSYSTALSEDNRPCITFEYNYVKPL